MAFLIDPAGQVFRRKFQALARNRHRLCGQRADLARHLARLALGVAGRHHHIDEAGDGGIVGAERTAHHQHRKRTLVSHGAGHQQAGGAFRHQAEMDERRREGSRRGGQNVVAMEQHGGADPDRDAIDRGDDRHDVVRQGIKKLGGVGGARRIGVGGAVFQKTLQIVAGGKYPGAAGDDHAADVRIVLRGIDGVAHAAIHFLGDRVLLFRPPQLDHPRRAFVGDYQMPGHKRSLQTSGRSCRWRVFQPYPTSSRRHPKPRRLLFNGDVMTREGHAVQLTGIHHLTAISAKPRENLAFYTGLLGMRLVKKTVNQDDVSAYHLFYADGKANPGTDLTFFDFPAAPERRGTNSISRTGLRVAGEKSLGYWKDRLNKAGGHTGDITEVDGRLTLPFEDGEGQRLVLVDDGGAGSAFPWEKSVVPAEHQIRGLGPIVLNVHDLARLEKVLTGVMNMRRERDYAAPDARAQVHVFAMGEGGPAAELHVIEQKDLPIARQGAGGVHHVAFRTPDETQYHAWTRRLTDLRIPNSGEIDRFYFRSLYFREPNGILFEIATDGPGFASDEPIDKLGEKFSLPPCLEPRRAQIEAGLKP